MEKWLLLWICSFLAIACTSLTPDPKTQELLGQEMWLATNLRIYQKQSIYWQNYIDGEIVPVGTPVRLKNIDNETAIMVDNYNREFILYWRFSRLSEDASLVDCLERYLSTENPLDEIEALPPEDFRSIQLGEIKRGMSKKLVLWSMGWPPDLEKKDRDIWIYFTIDRRKRAVYFENDVVVDIIYVQ